MSLERNDNKIDNKCSEKFSKFIIYSLRMILGIIVIASIIQLRGFILWKQGTTDIVLICLYVFSVIGIYFAIKNKVDKKRLIIILTSVGLILRLIWIFSINNTPISDFQIIYQSAMDINNNNFSSMMGTAYLGRFPHFIVIALYFSRMILLFNGNTYIALKVVNVIVSTLSIPVMYYILEEVFDDYKKVIIGTFLMSIIPCSILYTSVYCAENIAILFFLVSIYLFIKAMKKEKNGKILILCGLVLLIGHLFRMESQIIIISYIMYILIYEKQKLLRKIKSISYIVLSFTIPFLIFSNVLIYSGITDQKLYGGSEPHITSLS